jgi:hypothetical protein
VYEVQGFFAGNMYQHFSVMKDVVFWDVTPSCGSCTNRVSEECIASIIMGTRIGELGTLAVPSSLTLVTLMTEVTFL